jgi:glycerophosphoryl diester phosphodiesterase
VPAKPYLDWPGPIAFAHRGAHDGAKVVENTMTAFAAAVELGYHYVETDVHATADDVLVAFHDDRLDRVTDRSGAIRDLPWREVKRARVGTEPVPLLEDLLGEWPELRVNIEPKSDAAVDPLAAVLTRTRASRRVCVGSFVGRRTTSLRRALGAELCTATGPFSTARLRVGSFGLPVGRIRSDCAQVPLAYGPIRLVDHRFVAGAHRRGIQVHVWTIDDEAEMDRLLDLGVDGIMTDRAVLLRDVLERRGAWY